MKQMFLEQFRIFRNGNCLAGKGLYCTHMAGEYNFENNSQEDFAEKTYPKKEGKSRMHEFFRLPKFCQIGRAHV